MALTTGAKLGPYEIAAQLGAGGMGEVYRAGDTRLGRDVAIKVLPPQLSSDPIFLERFEREARTISALSHPNICALFDVGRADGIEYLVLELVEGESLAQRLGRGALPFEQVLSYGIQIADALECAHRRGIVHRDLKPGNIMVTRSGLKLLDFGLAKPVMAAAASSAFGAMTASHPNAPLTAQGTIVGTFQYMAPEQLEGHEADARSDLFALGCVLYEMASGRRPFEGKTQASLVAAVLASEPPPISSLQQVAPPAFDRALKLCLAKDPDERWQTAHDLKLQLKWIAEGGSQAGVPAPVTARRRHREWLAWSVATALLIAAGVLGFAYWRNVTAVVPVMRATLLPPAGVNLDFMARNGPPMLSPDGSKVAFVALKDGNPSIWLRRLDSMEAGEVPGTAGGYFPFWSPDGRYLAFFAEGKLKKILVEGGSPQTICDAEDARGGSWGKNDDIIFAPNRFSAIQRVSAGGGQPSEITKNNDFPNGASHRWPFFLPDGRHFLYVTSPTGSQDDADSIHFASLDGKVNRVVVNASSNPVFASGRLLYVSNGILQAAAFDPVRGVLTGEAKPVADSMQYDALFTRGVFSVSENGILAYQRGTSQTSARLIWMDHSGKELSSLGEPAIYGWVRLSPDGGRAATSISAITSDDIWIFDVKRGTRTRLTYGNALTGTRFYGMSFATANALWAPDGKSLYFVRRGHSFVFGIHHRAGDGSGQEDSIFESTNVIYPSGISRDGKYLAVFSGAAATKLDIWIIPLTGDHKPFVYLQTPYNESNAQFSPDGHWLAYQSDESGRVEIYLAGFPEPTGKIQVSASGGTQPVFNRDGKKLYFLTPTSDLMETDVAWLGGKPAVGTPRKLFNVRARNNFTGMFDVSPDGRFLVVSSGPESTEPVTLVTNWPALLKQ